MMTIKEIIIKEKEELNNLLGLLEKQHAMVLAKDVFGLEALVDEIKAANKGVASMEMERRKIAGTKSMSLLVKESGDEETDREFREVKKLLEAIKLQKETNELLIKQRMSYNNQILSIINPSREVKTYNSYGNLRK
ncbi:flagellar export chaperone FlgN [Clostridium sp. HCP1S3_B4]|uniref:flagellar export chaperone FlgN n=1 Tax=unclassified Clostridium TaxID=2614128 RepID=UPI002A792640|nr:flagellar export chaperone FlgN [Clostridiales bacterium]MDY2729500.1 flagellar export chaperone FlgN [Clostridium sp.]